MIPNYNGDDSNITIAKRGEIIDILDSVQNGSYEIIEGECQRTKIDDTKNSTINPIIKISEKQRNPVTVEAIKSLEELDLNTEFSSDVNITQTKKLLHPQIKTTINNKEAIKEKLRTKVQKFFLDIIKKLVIHY